jgi:Mycotoxin biosynthesis protein UstYa
VIRAETQFWNLTLGVPTKYTRPASPEVDALWDEITAPPGKGLLRRCLRSISIVNHQTVGRVKAQKDELRRANLTSIPLADGSGYFATLDVFHQIHCLVSSFAKH